MSRQDRQDFYKRKRNIERVTAKSAQLQEAVVDYEVNQRAFEEEKATEEEAKQFEGMAQQLHHLLGTSSIPGVFTSPYGASFETSAYGIPMEDHLKDAFHNRQVRIRRKQVRYNKFKLFSPPTPRSNRMHFGDSIALNCSTPLESFL